MARRSRRQIVLCEDFQSALKVRDVEVNNEESD